MSASSEPPTRIIKTPMKLPSIARHFEIYMAAQTKEQELIDQDLCPKCEDKLINESGCSHCPNCGWAACE